MDQVIVAIDTSVVVAGLIAAHPRHVECRAWLAAAATKRVRAVMALHGVAETWAVLTRAPIAVPLDGGSARTLLAALRTHVTPLAPEERTYDAAFQRCADLGLRGGAVYDALHLVTAEHAGVDLVLTENRGDFERLRLPFSPPVATASTLPPVT